MAVSVEAPAFIAIGRSFLKGCGFDSHCRPGSFLRNNSRPVMYGAVGSLASSGVLGPFDLGSIPTRAFGFNRVMTLSKLRMYTCALANKLSIPSGSVNCYRQSVEGNSALRSVRGGEVGD